MASLWYPVTITQVHLVGGFHIILTTDAPCHLWLYWTDKVPWVHRTSTIERGLNVPWDSYWCYVVWSLIEQQEPGDTTTHTFTWLGWEHCQTKYFRFHGTIAGVNSPSDSPIFSKHYTTTVAPGPVIFPYLPPCASFGQSWWMGNAFQAPATALPATLNLYLRRPRVWPQDCNVYIEECVPHEDVHYPFPDQEGHIMGKYVIPQAVLDAHLLECHEYVCPLEEVLPLTQGLWYAVTRYPSVSGSAFLQVVSDGEQATEYLGRLHADTEGYVNRDWSITPGLKHAIAFSLEFA